MALSLDMAFPFCLLLISDGWSLDMALSLDISFPFSLQTLRRHLSVAE